MSDIDLTKGLVNDYINSQSQESQEETSQEQVTVEATATTEQPQENPNTETSSLHNESTTEETPVEESETVSQTEESSTETQTTEETTSETESQTDDEVLSPEEFIEYIYSETEGNEELREQLLNKFGVSKDPFANEQVAQLNKFIQETGRSVDDYYRIQSLNTENMDVKTAVMASLALDNPEMSSEELNLLFEDTYKTNEDEYSTREMQIGQVKLKQDGAKALNRLNELKSEWSKPLPKQDPQAPQEYLPSNFGDTFKNEVSDIASFEFDLNDKGEKFEYKIDDKYAESVQPVNPQDPLSRYRNQNGQIDAYQMAEEQALIDNIDSIIKSVYQQGFSKGQKTTVVDKKNLNITQENRPPSNDKPTRQQEQTRSVLDKVL